jgi:hypothetical protein
MIGACVRAIAAMCAHPKWRRPKNCLSGCQSLSSLKANLDEADIADLLAAPEASTRFSRCGRRVEMLQNGGSR